MAKMGNSVAGDALPPKLNGIEEGTFVFFTISERWPKTIAKIVDHIHCKRLSFIQQYGQEADADVKSIIADLSEIRYRMTTDKPLENISDTSYSYEMWNKALSDLRQKHGADEVSWFKTDWLFTECYMYRRIIGSIIKTKYLKSFDCFREQKIEGFNSHLEQIRDGINYMFSVAEKLNEQQERETIEVLLKMCLWGNKADLSLSCGESTTMRQSPIEAARVLDAYILCNDFKTAIDSFFLKLKPCRKGTRQLHIVLDNAGPELMGDLIFAEYLMETKLVDKTVLHGKEYPYFVSDATGGDFEWTLSELNKIGGIFQKMYQRLSERVKKDELVFRDHRFWTYPQPYCEMKSMAPDLYVQLSEASIIIFKGDLNYRKLVADRDWPYETPLKTALCGFLPAPLLALRTLKSETVAGLPEDIAERMRQEPDRKWMTTGEYGIAELAF
ncbi:phage minor structural protein [Necator americanus]|uniref:Sugar phosphate phosphatase n=1 Tax=Necator americanus TaxID=51031 RepID=W2TUC6_NECAM|nr:phage minor structural protein [Necator americanus]ETN85700.1 phage minor structural protein [Necator americanus]